MTNCKVFITSLVIFVLPAIAFSQTSKSIELGTYLSELRCSETKEFMIIISHGSMAKGHYCSYDSVNFIVGVNTQNKVIFVETSDQDFIIDGVKYLKIKFKDLDSAAKAGIRYESPFAYYIRINSEWLLAYDPKDSFEKNGKRIIKKNTLPMFAFKRENLSKKQL